MYTPTPRTFGPKHVLLSMRAIHGDLEMSQIVSLVPRIDTDGDLNHSEPTKIKELNTIVNFVKLVCRSIAAPSEGFS